MAVHVSLFKCEVLIFITYFSVPAAVKSRKMFLKNCIYLDFTFSICHSGLHLFFVNQENDSTPLDPDNNPVYIHNIFPTTGLNRFNLKIFYHDKTLDNWKLSVHVSLFKWEVFILITHFAVQAAVKSRIFFEKSCLDLDFKFFINQSGLPLFRQPEKWCSSFRSRQ